MATAEEVLERYPQLAGFINHPEIGQVLLDAARDGLGATELQGKIYATDWYKKSWADLRQYELLRSTDPAEFKLAHQQAAFDIGSLLTKLGVNVSKNPKMAEYIANDWLRHGKDYWYLYSALGKYLSQNPDMVGQSGELGARMQKYRQMASDYLLDYDDAVFARTAVNEWMQVDTTEAIENRYRQEAIKRFGHLEDVLTRGITVRQAMQPMTTAVARTLEMSPDQVDLNDPRWRQLVEFADPDSGKIRTMTTSEAERWARRQDEFQYTATAREETFSMADELLRTFGQVA